MTSRSIQIRSMHRATCSFQIEKGVHQGCVLSPCLCNFYAFEIARLEEAQSGIKTAERNVNNLRYADDPEMGNSISVLWRQGMESTNR